ncbi:hypothetical protein KIPB_007070 [Kipferlia bialata]|uniref:GST C-terminal domain-containing protein n=1 Tax=Kipferlia bialata TaxID=797122 RepID=A0A391NM66_9EUKA|nr:hypothetical protein KIPB_007070 [Kipferlia bialata]|eukprot:g7070.t1
MEVTCPAHLVTAFTALSVLLKKPFAVNASDSPIVSFVAAAGAEPVLGLYGCLEAACRLVKKTALLAKKDGDAQVQLDTLAGLVERLDAACGQEHVLNTALRAINDCLAPRTFVCGAGMTVCDLVLFSCLCAHLPLIEAGMGKGCASLVRYVNFMHTELVAGKALASGPCPIHVGGVVLPPLKVIVPKKVDKKGKKEQPKPKAKKEKKAPKKAEEPAAAAEVAPPKKE